MSQFSRRISALAVASLTAISFSSPSAASVETLREHVTYLASDALEGRLTGTEGEAQANEYLVAQLSALGVEPLPGADGLTHPFEFTAGTNDAGSVLTLTAERGEESWSGSETFQALSLSDNGSVTGEVVFAGYGLVLPESADFGYDSYVGLDVEDKIVVVLRYFPEDVEQETRAVFSRYSGLRYRAMQARERGAKALLLVTGPNSPNAGETIAMSFDSAIAGSGLIAASANGDVANRLFDFVADKSLEQAQTALDDGNPHVAGFAIPGVQLTLDVKVEREQRIGHNIVGVLPRNVEGDVDKPYVMLGAHYDHLGRGTGGNSLARKEEAGGIHNGADDNASGVAAVLEMVAALAAKERRRDVIVALWSGEELGAAGLQRLRQGRPGRGRGSRRLHQLRHGRPLADNKLALRAMGSSSIWPELVEQSERARRPRPHAGRRSLPADRRADLQPGRGAVHSTSSPAATRTTTGRRTTRTHQLRGPGADRALRHARSHQGHRISTSAPDFLKVEPKTDSGGDRDSVRAFTGTIPDYTTEVEGLLLSRRHRRRPGRARRGSRRAMSSSSSAGQTITNIYDYTYALDAVKIGEPLQVVLEREGERVEVTITPRARD